MVRPNCVLTVLVAVLALALAAGAQQTPAQPTDQQASQPAPASPLPSPSITGPLGNLPPAIFNAGPLGKVSVNGILDGQGSWTGNYIPGDNATQTALSNGQIFLQKTDGWFQFYVQAGAYNLPALGAPFTDTNATLTNLYGPVPVAYAKFQATKNTSVLVGSLPTLIGAEYTFTFENMNIERGLLWNQESAISRGVQVNQTLGKFSASLSWNDGFYSNRYSWLTGSLAYANGPHTLAFVAGGNMSQTAYQSFATPLQNNSRIYNIIYTYNKSGWILQPYWQYTDVPVNPAIGVTKATSTNGFAILASRSFKKGFSLPVRWEYIASSGSATDGSANLMYGSGSSATSFTVSPTLQRGGFFVRGDLSYVHLSDVAPGAGFGQAGTKTSQPRAMVELGFMFGNNIVEEAKK